jgi:hypothetical protein
MRRIRISRKSAYLVFIPTSIGIFSWAWWYFGPFSLGAFAFAIGLYAAQRTLIKKLFRIEE